MKYTFRRIDVLYPTRSAVNLNFNFNGANFSLKLLGVSQFCFVAKKRIFFIRLPNEIVENVVTWNLLFLNKCVCALIFE